MGHISSAFSNIGPFRSTKTITIDGTNNNGELDQPTITLFTVTGEVLILALVPWCSEDLTSAGGGTLALGITGNTTLFIGATTATAIDNGEFWTSTTPTANGVLLPSTLQTVVITDNIIATVATADITDGTIRFDCLWFPLSSDGLIT